MIYKLFLFFYCWYVKKRLAKSHEIHLYRFEFEFKLWNMLLVAHLQLEFNATPFIYLFFSYIWSIYIFTQLTLFFAIQLVPFLLFYIHIFQHLFFPNFSHLCVWRGFVLFIGLQVSKGIFLKIVLLFKPDD